MSYRQGMLIRIGKNQTSILLGTYSNNNQLAKAIIIVDKSKALNEFVRDTSIGIILTLLETGIQSYSGSWNGEIFTGIMKSKNSIFKGQIVANPDYIKSSNTISWLRIFEHGKKFGLGILKNNYSQYKGGFVNGKQQGYGIAHKITPSIEHIYNGYFKENLKHGFGKEVQIKYGMKVTYKGYFHQNKRCGSGIHQDNNKMICSSWSDDCIHGQGTQYYYHKQASVYVGTFIANSLQGSGTEIGFMHCHFRKIGYFNQDFISGVFDSVIEKQCGAFINGQATRISSNEMKLFTLVDSLQQGYGFMINDHVTYKGSIYKGLKLGSGLEIVNGTKDKVCGTWQIYIHGQASVHTASLNMFYVGNFVQSCQKGIGTCFNLNNQVILKVYLNMSDMSGQEIYQQGEKIICGYPNRQGTEIFQSRIYVGEFSKRYKHGLGIEINECHYAGYFHHGIAQGSGLRYNKQLRYLGMFSKCLVSDQGTVTGLNYMYIGENFNHSKHGFGILTDSLKISKGHFSSRGFHGITTSQSSKLFECGSLLKTIGEITSYDSINKDLFIGSLESQKDRKFGILLKQIYMSYNQSLTILASKYFGYLKASKGTGILIESRLCQSQRRSSTVTTHENQEIVSFKQECGWFDINFKEGTQCECDYVAASTHYQLVQKISSYNLLNITQNSIFKIFKESKFQDYKKEYYLSQGEFCNGLLHGEGIQRLQFIQYKGQFENGHRSGYGIIEGKESNRRILDSGDKKEFINQVSEVYHEGYFLNDNPVDELKLKICGYRIDLNQYLTNHIPTIYQDHNLYLEKLKNNVIIFDYKKEMLYKNNQLVTIKMSSIDGTQMTANSNTGTIRSQAFIYEGEIENQHQNAHGYGHLRSVNYSYQGYFRNTKFDGYGQFIHQKYIYEGNFQENQLVGFVTDENGNKYEGPLLNGFPHGYGVLAYTSGDKYEGYFYSGDKHGWGKLSLHNGLIQKGYFLKNIFISGFIQNDNDTYLGTAKIQQDKERSYCLTLGYMILSQERTQYINEWRRSFKMGQLIQGTPKISGVVCGGRFESGSVEWAHGTTYEGQLAISARQNGFGKLTQINGTIYEGTWVEGVIHGFGKAIFDDGSIYEGSWKVDQPEGEGTYTWFISGSQYKQRLFQGLIRSPMPIMGDTFSDELYLDLSSQDFENANQRVIQIKEKYQYVGSWRKGQFEGYGELTADGISYKGEFKDHLMHGRGTLTINFSEYTGKWQNGIFMSGTIDLTMLSQHGFQRIPYLTE